ncbi:GntR family transcriptional regulator [Mycobacterium sp. NAZ190054]|uniref:GntR family transcriptional regulator n=1 Tax=Mycobacterium sp. NAZ190054 TaxID=1747766 RepID=UPI000797BA66|nr:FCD domain-containing protein [Mycobacterium sp. NAZ190054]KWX67083.1 GntR family transcriptional regulator [Mycobacterium sp. NAZ190054]
MTPAVAKSRAQRSGAYERLRSDILGGRIEPGTRLRFAALVEQYGCSIGAIREALQRLAEQGLVESEWQQGFRIVDISAGDLIELTDARCEIEALALRYAISSGDVRWEADAISAHHVLERTPMYETVDGTLRFSEEWVIAHNNYHAALMAGCGNRRILAAAHNLRDAAELYRRWSAPLHDQARDIAGEHKAILDAVVGRDAALADSLLRAHIRRTTDKLLEDATNHPVHPS